ncbi:MAG TPA: DUF2020 domain-containing protein [Pseudonocardiaceae bacterium]|nr:DUF2020 domain-containing protein [Pseudonocardiaceae bacterium]
MRRAVFLAAPLAVLGVVLAGCGPTVTGTAAPASTITSHIKVPPPSVAAPATLPPARTANCPYLSLDEVQNDNGQHVGSVKISSSSDGQPHPVCYFYRPDGHLQMTVRVYVGTAAVATAVVNQAAPVSSSDPANQPSGWNGGSQANASASSQASSTTVLKGAVYAIAKGGTAIVVMSNQLQTIKCRLVATAVVSGLNQ